MSADIPKNNDPMRSESFLPEKPWRFVGEQDGPSEREFKSKLIPVLKGRAVRAYLAVVTYGVDGNQGVALCIRNLAGTADSGAVKDVGKVFASIFSSKVHLDIIFLTPDQEISVNGVCRPFFVAE